jgi:hypothetical protein
MWDIIASAHYITALPRTAIPSNNLDLYLQFDCSEAVIPLVNTSEGGAIFNLQFDVPLLTCSVARDSDQAEPSPVYCHRWSRAGSFSGTAVIFPQSAR